MTEEFTFGGVTLDPKDLKMEKEFNLSEKIFELGNLKLNTKDKLYENYDVESGGAKFISPKDVKEAVRLLKEKASSWQCSGQYCNAHCDAIDSIKEIFGEKLA